jgi:hypothetical protein
VGNKGGFEVRNPPEKILMSCLSSRDSLSLSHVVSFVTISGYHRSFTKIFPSPSPFISSMVYLHNSEYASQEILSDGEMYFLQISRKIR